jgi:hypothetical protein
VPIYWIRPEKILSAKAGMHRFVWDLHYPPPDVLEHSYPISAIYKDTPRYPLGAVVPPGDYTIKLTAAGKSYSQKLIIKMDPRVKATLADLQKQSALSSKVTQALKQDFAALRQIRGVKARMAELVNAKIAADAASSLNKKLSEVEMGTSANEVSGFGIARLNGAFASLLDTLESADQAPTAQAMDMYTELSKVLTARVAAWNELRTKDIPALNEELSKLAIAPIKIE